MVWKLGITELVVCNGGWVCPLSLRDVMKHADQTTISKVVQIRKHHYLHLNVSK